MRHVLVNMKRQASLRLLGSVNELKSTWNFGSTLSSKHYACLGNLSIFFDEVRIIKKPPFYFALSHGATPRTNRVLSVFEDSVLLDPPLGLFSGPLWCPDEICKLGFRSLIHQQVPKTRTVGSTSCGTLKFLIFERFRR